MVSLKALIVDDSAQDAALLVRELEKAGYDLKWARVDNAADMGRALDEAGWDVVLCDFVMPGFSGPAALKIMREKGPDFPFIIVSGQIGENVAVEAMRSGAHDYIMKGNLKRLVPVIRRELAEADNRRQRRRAEEELRRSEVELRTLAHRLFKAQEDERRGIARELHDQTGQSLTVLALLLDQIKIHAAEDGQAHIKEAMEVIQEISSHIRGLSYSLRPGMLDDVGLLPTLTWYFQEFEKRAGVKVEFSHSGLEDRLTPDVNINVFRIVQEALTNVVKYSGVKKARVAVQKDGSRLLIEIEDKGKGFDAGTVPPTSSGLRGIRERALALGGKAMVESAPSRGTCVRVEIPLEMALAEVVRPARSRSR